MNKSPIITHERFVTQLENLSQADIELAGGKGANLGELIQAGFPVPEGFVITTEAYDVFIETNRLNDTIDHVLVDHPANGDEIQSAILGSAVPSELEQAIKEAYRAIGQGGVAVRSSATAEDLPGATYAGQHDTYLNVVGEEGLLTAVKKCWASLWSQRAIAYRERQHISIHGVKLAVVVQVMIPADTAGVMFTANPITGARDEIVIDSNPGLGEAVVSGRVTPDHSVLERTKHGWRIKNRQAGQRELVIQVLLSGGTQELMGKSGAETTSPPSKVLIKLARLGSAIEKHFGKPQDIEWAFQAGRLYILQSRPMTALPPEPPRLSKPVQMLSAVFAEMLSVRPYPLDMTTWMKALSAAAIDPVFSLIGIKPPSFELLFEQREGVVVLFNGNVPVHLTAGLFIAPARLIYLALRYNPTHWRQDPKLVSALKRVHRLDGLDPQALNWVGLLEVIQLALKLPRPLAGEMRRRYLPRPLLSIAVIFVILKAIGLDDHLGTLLSGTESDTIQANRELEIFGEQVRQDSGLAKIFDTYEPRELKEALEKVPSGINLLKTLDGFMEQYGHREVVISTALEPTWKDAPQVVLGIIKGLASESRPAKSAPAWQVAQQEILDHRLFRFPPLRALMIRLLTNGRWLWRIREDTHFEATRILPILRHVELELGTRLVEMGVLTEPKDVFHFRFEELEHLDGKFPLAENQLHDLQDRIEKRKIIRCTLEGKPVVDPRFFQQVEKKEGVVVQGTAGSPGLAEGRVRVIHDASEFSRLQAGEVLVAPYTNPSWTLLFQRAAAVIVDAGAAGSHAAIVAREYGIPAVMGTVFGTVTLHDGDLVQVDGTNGIVRTVQEHSTT